MLSVYMHPRCSDSYNVYLLLERNSLLERVKLVNTERNPLQSIRLGVFSVPAFVENERVILQGYLSEAEILSLLTTGRIDVPSLEVAVERLMKSVFSSFLVASVVYLSGSFEPVAHSEDYVLSASGAFFITEQRKFLEVAKERLTTTTFDESIERSLLRVIAGNFVRDYYWLRGEVPTRESLSKLGEEYFRDWLFLRASLGRIFVPHSQPPEGLKNRVRKAWEYLLERVDTISARVLEEQSKIPNDWLR